MRLFEVLPNFSSPEVKLRISNSNKHGIYELLHELKNDLRLRILENYKKPGKSQKFIESLPSAQYLLQNEILPILAKTS